MLRQLPPVPAWSSAFIAALVGFGGTVTLIVQALRMLGASVEQIGSAVTASCLGVAVAGAALSFALRMPVVLAWSTPGAALLAASTTGTSWPVAVGVFLAAGLMSTLIGVVPHFGRLAERIPSSIASAMLAGVLLPFCLGLFKTGASDPLLVGVVIGAFLIARARVPSYALIVVLAAGLTLTLLRGDVTQLSPGTTVGTLAPTSPSFDARAIGSLGVPLLLVTLASQNLPGLVVLRAAGYSPRTRPLLVGTGLASLAMAPFGAHSVNLAAITAAICSNRDAHPEHAKRWTVGVIYAAFYLVLALLSPALVRLFLSLPHALTVSLTGVALIPAILGAIETMLAAKADRDPAIVTFLAAGSGLTLFGMGSAFWGLILGVLALAARTTLARGQRNDAGVPSTLR